MNTPTRTSNPVDPAKMPPVREQEADAQSAQPQTDEAAKKTPSEVQHADYGAEHFDLKEPTNPSTEVRPST